MSRTILLLTVLAALGQAGCAPVAPWERGLLAKPQMALDPLAQHNALRAHQEGSREAGSRAAQADGGGCGCY